uniref:Dihydrolipoyl dehydrogenase n=1 Tax=Candidatus Kentrum sp. SD TaxID=2126332 RepID=A0A450YS16_9GAMM|nr:MAG: dihydrolipoamide dehydrogenase [Candidatus Kentron sp. SD]VFK44338.1 MAG: dihydrolipoamide dehydrogenase [Candidatus Kentron sp. SD]
MSETVLIEVPDIGDFKDVEIIEVLVSAGDRIESGMPLITIESDKASMEIPSPQAGVIKELVVAVGDRISMGSPIASVEIGVTSDNEDTRGNNTSRKLQDAPPGSTGVEKTSQAPPPEAHRQKAESKTTSISADIQADVVVLGAGPGGYTAAFRAADLGRKTVLVERYPALGGVCLNVGCIPSKAYLHVAGVIEDARRMAERGVVFGGPDIDLARLAAWKGRLVNRLAKGIASLAKQRKVTLIQGVGAFSSPNLLTAQTADGPATIAFEHTIIAVGSRAIRIPGFSQDPRIWDSTDALRLQTLPERLLIIGGGVIGLEMATLYNALGSRITIVERQDDLIPGCDGDLVRVFRKHIAKRWENIFTGTGVTDIQPLEEGLRVFFSGEKAPASELFDTVLVSVGRTPNGGKIGAEKAGVHVDERGFIPVDGEQRTNIPHILAIGDVVGQPMLAHKALHEGKVAAEVAAGHAARFDAHAIPSVAYTDPEVAWMGVTENQARAQGILYEKATFPWSASGRALGMDRGDGMTKLLFDKNTRRIIGAGIVGPHAGDLISEAVLALEMGADFEDMGMTIHPHPTLSETLGLSAEMIAGTITDLMPPRRRGRSP